MYLVNYLSKNISFLRKKLEISQQELANRLYLSRSNIASYESGKAEPKAIKLVEIARFFNISMTQLIEENLEQLSPEKIRTSNANIQEKLNKLLENRKVMVNVYELKTEQLKKVAVGLRALHDLKINQIESPSTQLLVMIRDFENLLEVMDKLVAINEEVVSYLKKIVEEEILYNPIN